MADLVPFAGIEDIGSPLPVLLNASRSMLVQFIFLKRKRWKYGMLQRNKQSDCLAFITKALL
jgi:hypothetical protein